MKMFFTRLILSASALCVLSLAACEQQSPSVTAPEAYKKKQAAREQAAGVDQANPNPPTFFGN